MERRDVHEPRGTEMIRISEDSWYHIFLLASSSIQELYQMSLTCKEWYKLIRKEKLLLLFVNLHVKRLLYIWPQPLRSLILSDNTFMAGGATLSVLCGLAWFPGDLDLYSTDFKRWGFLLSQSEEEFYQLKKESFPDNGKYMSSADFYSLYSNCMGFRLIKTYLSGFGKIDFIETKQEAKNVLQEFDFPFLRNAFFFKGGKVAKVILGDLRSLVLRHGNLNYNPILAYLQEQMDQDKLDAWRNSRDYEKWQKRNLLSLRTNLLKWFTPERSDLSLSVPGPFCVRLRILMERVNKYKLRGFEITEASLDAFLAKLDDILRANPSSRSKKRIKLT